VSARLAVVYIDGEHRRLMVTGGEATARFAGLRASQQARVDEEIAGDKAKLQGFTARLENASIDGGKNRPAS
jgi:hypothetical protein